MRPIPRALAIVAACLVAGCADDADTNGRPEAAPAGAAAEDLRLPPDPAERGRAAVESTMSARDIRELPVHRHAAVDLDGDGADDLLVWLDDPNWCTPTGCTLLVFHREGNADVLIAEVSSVRSPIAVAEQTHGGWRDILVEVGGETVTPGIVALQHDGIGYPGDPTLMAALASDVVPRARVVID